LGCGTVFELSPTASGPWNETILYNFQNNGQDGFFPSSGVIFDPSGNLYGENSDGGGTGNFGTVFELSPVNNSWKETALHSFSGGNADGSSPTGGLALDTAGNLYGTTTSGGAYQSYGTVFELSPSSEGNWSETILHSFNDNGRDGYEPEHGVALDAAGNVYGTTFTGGRGVGGIGLGTIFELTPGADGTWRETIVHNFGSSPNDGYFPGAGLLLDGQGNIFGTTTFGGDCNSRFNGDCGTAYEVQPKTGGGWIETVLYTFPFDSDVHSDLIFGRSGNLYGTTELGGGSHNCEVFGHYGCGSAFEVKP
jgi:hypothetical protein